MPAVRPDALNVLITGANRGIGLSLAKKFASSGFNVIGTSRKTDPQAIQELAQVAVGVVPLDVTSEASIQALPSHVAQVVSHLDIVVNNAGTLVRDTIESVSFQSMQDQYVVNTIAPLMISRTLFPLLRASPHRADRVKSSKIIQITSSMGSIADNGSGGYYGYRASKCALNMVNRSLSLDVKDITFIALHPGYIATRMTGGNGDMGPEECAERLFKVITNCKAENTGNFVHRDGHTLQW